jgi:phospholipid transport system substrate-binding protein
MYFNSSLCIAFALTGIVLGGCGQAPKDQLNSFLSSSEKDIAELASFETASGPENLHPAAQRIEDLSREVISILSDSSGSKKQREAHFGQLLARDLDIPLIARFVIGKHWRRVTIEQKRNYISAFKNYVIQTYSARLGGAEVDSFKIINTKVIGKKDILVVSNVAKAGAKPIRADWRLRQRNGTYRILDLSVEGISMALTLRQEFSSILKNENGVSTLISILQKRNA